MAIRPQWEIDLANMNAAKRAQKNYRGGKVVPVKGSNALFNDFKYTVNPQRSNIQSSGGGGSRVHSVGGGGGSEGLSGDASGKNIPIYRNLFKAIKKDLNEAKFDPIEFGKRINMSVDDIRLKGLAASRAGASGLIGRGMIHSGQVAENIKDISDAETKDILSTLDQLGADERAFLEAQRQRGVQSARNLFGTQLGARTQQAIAEQNRKFQQELLSSQMAFAEQQKSLDRALEREKISAALSNAGKGSSFYAGLSGLLSGATSGYSLTR